MDLVRCPQHEKLENEYVVQVCSSAFIVWDVDSSRVGPKKPKWVWLLRHIRRVHWHKNVNKLEVEPGRSVAAVYLFYLCHMHSELTLSQANMVLLLVNNA